MQWKNKETNRFTFEATIIISILFFVTLFIVFYIGLNYREIIYNYKIRTILNRPVAQLTLLSEINNELDVNKDFIDNVGEIIVKNNEQKNVAVINVIATPSFYKDTWIKEKNKDHDNDIKTNILKGKGENIWIKGTLKLETSKWFKIYDFNIKDGDNIVFNINDNGKKLFYILHGTSLKNKNSNQFLFIKRHSDNNFNKKIIFSDGHSIETIYNPIPEFSYIVKNTQSEREKNFFDNILKNINNDKKYIIIHYGDYHVTSDKYFIDNDGKNRFKIYIVDMGEIIDVYSTIM